MLTLAVFLRTFAQKKKKMVEPYEETCYLWTGLRFASVLHENGTVSDRYESNSYRVSNRDEVRPIGRM